MKAAGTRKTRLAAHLGRDGREALSETLFDHVVATLRHCSQITRIIILSDAPPPTGEMEWIVDQGAGLNVELERVRAGLDMCGDMGARAGPLLIIHADLPLLTTDDLDALLTAAQDGLAIAPDREGTGTNALAFASPRPLKLCFGPDSFARHHAQVPDAAIITGRPGLALDIDTRDDLDEAVRLGFLG
jgi:2-phospho-L-lactate guanylyltransferase